MRADGALHEPAGLGREAHLRRAHDHPARFRGAARRFVDVADLTVVGP